MSTQINNPVNNRVKLLTEQEKEYIINAAKDHLYFKENIEITFINFYASYFLFSFPFQLVSFHQVIQIHF